MMPKKARPEGGAERGSSLIEVLIALLIMLFLMIGVLQLFTMAYLVNLGAGARTEMTMRAEQVMENIRTIQVLTLLNSGTVPTAISAVGATGITFPIAAAQGITPIDPTANQYWGPAGANVFPSTSTDQTPFRVYYTIEDADPYWRLTVTVIPTNVSGARKYLGAGISHKRVDYVSQITKS